MGSNSRCKNLKSQLDIIYAKLDGIIPLAVCTELGHRDHSFIPEFSRLTQLFHRDEIGAFS